MCATASDIKISSKKKQPSSKLQKLVFFFLVFGFFSFFSSVSKNPKPKPKEKIQTPEKKLTQGKTNTRQELHNQKQQQ
jgi:hypothetical protein